MNDDETFDHQLALLPRDGLFLKDGRGWYTSTTNRAQTYSWPNPSTLRGALCTTSGFARQEATGYEYDSEDWESHKDGTPLRSVVALRREIGVDWSHDHRMWPTPEDAFYEPDDEGATETARDDNYEIARLEPKPPSDGIERLAPSDQPEAIEHLWYPEPPSDDKPADSPNWWPEDEFVSWLAGDPPNRHDADRDDLTLVERTQIHVSIDPETGTVEDEKLHASNILEMHQMGEPPPVDEEAGSELETGLEWAIGLQCDTPNEDEPFSNNRLKIGGKGHLADVESTGPDVFDMPEKLGAVFKDEPAGLRLFAVTPLHFERGWMPDGFVAENGDIWGHLPGLEGDLVLRSACVPRPIHVSGWDMARGGPKPTRRLVRPGSVYFFEKASGDPFGEEDARALWLTHVGRDRDDGYGCVVPGVWHPDDG